MECSGFAATSSLPSPTAQSPGAWESRTLARYSLGAQAALFSLPGLAGISAY